MKRSFKIISVILSVMMLASLMSVFSVFADAAELASIAEEVNLRNLGVANYHEGRKAIRVKFSVNPEVPEMESVIEFGGIVRKNEGVINDMVVDTDGNLINPVGQAKYSVFKNQVQTGKVWSLDADALCYTTFLYDLDLADHLNTKYSFIGFAIIEDSDGNREVIYSAAYNNVSYNALVCRAKGHVWDDGVVTVLPTVEENGLITYTCERCGSTKEAPVALPAVNVEAKEPAPIYVGGVQVTPLATAEYTTAEDPTESVFADWKADYTISFDNAIASNQVYLYGQYGSYDNLPLGIDKALAAGEEYKLLENLAAQYSMPNWADVRYSELAAITPFTSGVLSAAGIPDGTTATVKLNLYDDTGRVLTINEFSAVISGSAPAVPEVNVVDNGMGNVVIGGDTYVAVDSLTYATVDEDPAASAYADYYADYVVSFSNAVNNGQVYLYGQYGAYDNTALNVPALAAGQEFRLLTNLAQQYAMPNWGSVKYKEMAAITPFTCGAIVNDPVPAGTTITIKLNLYENADGTGEVITVDERTIAIDLVIPKADVTDLGGGRVEFNDRSYYADARLVYNLVEEDPSASDFSDWYVDYTVSFSESVPADNVYLYGQYGTYGNIPIAVPSLAAGEEIRLLTTLADQYAMPNWGTLKYKEMSAITPFTCGIVSQGTLDGVTVTVNLNLYENADGTGEVITVDSYSVVL